MSVGIPSGNALALGVCSITVDLESVDANTTAEQTFTVHGLKTGDVVFVNKPSAEAGLGIVNTRVSEANTLAVTLANVTTAAINEASETWSVFWVRPESGATMVKL